MCVLIGVKLMLLVVRVIKLEAEVGNVVFHGEATGALCVVTLDIGSDIQVTLPALVIL